MRPNMINYINHQGDTPLMVSIRKKESLETVKSILNQNPNVNIQNNYDGRTALMYSLYSEKIVEMLLEHGADVNVQDKMCGNTALINSILNSERDNKEKIIKMLLNHGANVNIKDRFGKTALMYANQYSKPLKLSCIVKMLLEYGADVNLQDMKGINTIMYAVMYKSTRKTINTLLKYNADINSKDYCDNNAITLAFPDVKVIETLLPTRKKFVVNTIGIMSKVNSKAKNNDYKILFTNKIIKFYDLLNFF